MIIAGLLLVVAVAASSVTDMLEQKRMEAVHFAIAVKTRELRIGFAELLLENQRGEHTFLDQFYVSLMNVWSPLADGLVLVNSIDDVDVLWGEELLNNVIPNPEADPTLVEAIRSLFVDAYKRLCHYTRELIHSEFVLDDIWNTFVLVRDLFRYSPFGLKKMTEELDILEFRLRAEIRNIDPRFFKVARLIEQDISKFRDDIQRVDEAFRATRTGL